MKRQLLYASLLMAGMLCVSPMSAQDQVVKLTTSKAKGEKVTLRVNQVKKGVTVDWGDGNPVSYAATGDDLLVIEGTAKGNVITLTASKKFNTLLCEDNALTDIDLSQAPYITSLFCQNNQLTTLDIAALSGLTDLNCSNNKLNKLVIAEGKNPNIENLNISGNELTTNATSATSTTFYYRPNTLQHLNVANNHFGALNLTGNRKLDVLICNDNGLKNKLNLAMSDSISAIVAHNNEFVGMATPMSGGVRIRKVVVNDNQIPAIDLESCTALHTLMCKNNELTRVVLPPKTQIDVMECGGNKLSFNSLPSARFKPTHMTYTPQDENIDITALLKHDDKGYYMDLCPDWNDRLKDPYVLKFHDYMLDPDGSHTIKAQWMKTDEKGQDVEMTKANASAKNNDYLPLTSNTSYGNVSFFNSYDNVYALLTCANYPELTYKTTAFRIKGVKEGINDAVANGKGLHVAAGHGQLTITAETETPVHVVAATGRTAWQGRMAAGQTMQMNLPSGVYVVNGKKVVL